MEIAVIGAGIAGLAGAHRLAAAGHRVTLFEASKHFGGHAHTVDVTLDGAAHGVDVGFLVYNERTYPLLSALFAALDVETIPSDMSFSVQASAGGKRLEWAGTSLATVFAQPGNLLRPAFLGMLRDLLRFNREATALARSGMGGEGMQSLGDFLEQRRYGQAFRDWYLLPMAGCIWSCSTAQMMAFPVATFARFCDNHGLLQIGDRPQWRTVAGGSRRYVHRMLDGIPDARSNAPVAEVRRVADGVQLTLASDGSCKYFDHALLAVHSDQALRMLADADTAERDLLGAIRYQQNRAVLHTDSTCLPRERRAWAAWNYQDGGNGCVCVHYLLNRLQALPFRTPLIVSLNPVEAPHPGTVIAEFDYAHPVFDRAAIAAQHRLPAIQGRRKLWFAGAWTGYGFHEDGLRSGIAAATALTRQAAPSMADAA